MINTMKNAGMRRIEWAALVALLLAAAFLRLYRLGEVPPGWRDDELINSLVISQHVIDGDWTLFYPDASGHEALYHILNAAMLHLFGPGAAGIRWLSVLLGVATVGLTFWTGRVLLGRTAGWLAALGLLWSFWALMYSRIGLRHVSLLPCMLGAWVAFWRGVQRRESGSTGWHGRWSGFVFAGLWLGVGMYTYFAARGLPLVVVAVALYWLLFDRAAWWRHRSGVAVTLVVTGLLAIPLLVTLARLPEMTGRVEELAVPLTAARVGDLGPLLEQTWATLGMFLFDGDSEWLYNLPHRPVFNLLGGGLLIAGLLVSFYRMLPMTRTDKKAESAFLLLWFFAGLAPGVLSVPAASLGHTIVAQPAAYFLPAVALAIPLEAWRGQKGSKQRVLFAISALVAAAFVASNAARDLGDYYTVWPERGMVRFLYRADLAEAAQAVNERPEIEAVAVGSALAGPWDRQAFLVDLERPVNDRWFDPRYALVFPAGGGTLILTEFPELTTVLTPILQAAAGEPQTVGALQLWTLSEPALEANRLDGGSVAFANGLTLEYVGVQDESVLLGWRAVEPPFELPAFELVSNPPPPGVDTRPRLSVFAHLLDSAGELAATADGLWVDPYSLHAGDLALQWHEFGIAPDSFWLEIGLYDPVTEVRVPLAAGEERLLIAPVQP